MLTPATSLPLAESATDEDPASRLKHLALESILRDPGQPRQQLGDLTELKASLQQNGLLQPLLVAPSSHQPGCFLLIAGERRFTAAQELGWKTVAAMVRDVEEHERLLLQLTENLLRQDLSALEEALGYQRLLQEQEWTQEQIAQRLGKSQPTINQTLKLLSLSEAIRQDYQTSDKAALEVSKSLLLEIAKVHSDEVQWRLWERAKQGMLTVRQAREARKRASDRKPVRLTFTLPQGLLEVTLNPEAASRLASLRAVLKAALAEWIRQDQASSPETS